MAAELSFWQAPVRDVGLIAAAEKVLHAEGYKAGPPDGWLDPRTVQALMAAQEDRELQPTGRLDRRTAAALGIDVEQGAAAGASARGERRAR